LRLASALWRFWYTHGYLSEGRAWLDEMLARPAGDEASADERDARVRAQALYGAATLASTQDNAARAMALWEESLALFRALGYRAGTASVLCALGIAALQDGDVARAAALCGESLEVSRAEGDPYAVARALLSLGQIAANQGDYARAQALFEECLALNQQAGDKSHSAIALLNLGHVAREQGEFARARQLYREGLALSQALDEKLRIGRELVAVATVEAAQGKPERAARLMGAAAALRDALGAGLYPIDRPATERTTELARVALGEEAFAAAYAAGRALSLEEAIAEALEETARQ
jgi:non-specific serine/threonine protein kinase